MGRGMVILQIPTGISAQGSACSKRFTTPFSQFTLLRARSLSRSHSFGRASSPQPRVAATQQSSCWLQCLLLQAICSRLFCPCPCQFCRGLSWLTPPCFPPIYHLFCNQTIDTCLQVRGPEPGPTYATLYPYRSISIHTYIPILLPTRPGTTAYAARVSSPVTHQSPLAR